MSGEEPRRELDQSKSPSREKEWVRISVEGALGRVSLNRPRALNALNYDMRAPLPDTLDNWARDPAIYASIIDSTSDRAFCAGGDLHELVRLDYREAIRQIAFEYTLNWQFECHPKPVLSLIDGLCMGSGVGLSIFNTHRIAGAGYKFAMPEVRIGFFPDVGATYFLSRLPDEIGLYLALTGDSISRGDAWHLGLATHCIDSSRFDEIRAALSEAEPVDPVLREFHEEPEPGDIVNRREIIRQVFSAGTVENIFVGLAQVRGSHQDWAEQTTRVLQKNSPTSVKVAFEQIRRGRMLSLKQGLQLEYRLAQHFLNAKDLYEGVRALLVEKDNATAWEPASYSQVTPKDIATCFELGVDEDLQLPDFYPSPGQIS